MKNWKQTSIAIALGLIFLLSGVGKVLNVAQFQDLINQLGFARLHLIAPLIIWVELALAFAFCFQIRIKQCSLISIILLIVFTGVYTFGYRIRGITDCGCFGSFYNLPTSSMFVYIRNICMLVAANYLYFTQSELGQTTTPKWIRKVAIVYSLIIVFFTGLTFHPLAFSNQEHPWKGRTLQEINIDEDSVDIDKQLIFFYSYSCSHCLNSVENLLAAKRYSVVDTIKSFVVNKDIAQHNDSLQKVWNERYPQLVSTVIPFDIFDKIDAFPTTLIIRNDSIVDVWVGEVPSPFIIATLY